MSKFFINRPIVAIVIAILTVILGTVSMFTLATSQFPDIVPTEILVTATYPGADAKTLAQAVVYADRAADERRRQHDLHELGQRQQRRRAALRRLRRQDRSQHRPGALRSCVWIRRSRSFRPRSPQPASPCRRPLTSPLMLVAINSPGRQAEPGLSHQLRDHQPPGSDHARQGSLPRADLRWPVRTSRLGCSRISSQSWESQHLKSSPLSRRRTTSTLPAR